MHEAGRAGQIPRDRACRRTAEDYPGTADSCSGQRVLSQPGGFARRHARPVQHPLPCDGACSPAYLEVKPRSSRPHRSAMHGPGRNSPCGSSLADIKAAGMATPSSRQEADMTFPNPSVATARVYRITYSDADRRGSGGTRSKLLLLVVALSPLV